MQSRIINLNPSANMYHGQNSITIEQVANGWMVILPYQPNRMKAGVTGGPFFAGIPDDDQLIHMAQVMQENMHKDPLLAKIERENREPSNTVFSDDNLEKTPLIELKNEGVHVFKTYDEVLAFLKSEFDKK